VANAKTQADLDAMECGNPRCTEDHEAEGLILTSTCHPRGGTLAFYRRGDGLLLLRCAVCLRLVTKIEVAP